MEKSGYSPFFFKKGNKNQTGPDFQSLKIIEGQKTAPMIDYFILFVKESVLIGIT
jgi:hypothetical protein